ncbi:MAG: single-stranded DNA-binding protein [Ruminococcaceae bacterium]|nr:single-stranded DNA-binding protein [Oscillospiraceae bacterium]
MEVSRNYVELWGVADAEPVLSHENHGQRFFKFPLRVERLSGQTDVPVVVASENLLRRFPVKARQPVRVVGQLRSFNNKSGQGSRLVITVLAQELGAGDGGSFNRIELSGVLCKQPYLRRTPLGRSICDVILAVNRHYGRADYLPCIAWGQVAGEVVRMSVGDRLSLEGRVQSRTYTKMLDSGPVERVAFEVSIMQLTDDEGEP